MSETINGVSFEDYAAACGNKMQGMPEAEVLKILGIEKPVWDDTLNKWNARFGELAREDHGILTLYGQIFANPKVGRFANVQSPAVDINALLKIVPDLNTYLKIQIHQSTAAKYGFDPVTVLSEYGIDLGKWGAVNMHYMNEQNALLSAPQGYAHFMAMHQHWERFFADKYAANKVDVGADIQF